MTRYAPVTAALAAVLLLTASPAYAVEQSSVPEAVRLERVLREAGITGGLIVHLGCGDGKVTAGLRASDSFTVHGLAGSALNLAQARRHIESRKLYGPISVELQTDDRLPYVDNLVRAFIVSDAGRVPRAEWMRVVCPGGIAVIDGKPVVKPWPKELAQWPQHYNTPDNNAVASDTVVGPPRHFRWIAKPEWSRSHLGLPSMHSLVSAGGRLYSIEDHASVEHPALPGKFALICRDAFNGIELWRHPFSDWHPVWVYIKFTPTQLQRQLAAIGDTVYCTPGLDAPITAFDAATGRVVREFDGTEQTQEFVYADGMLYVVTGAPYDVAGLSSTFKAKNPKPEGRIAPRSRAKSKTMGPSGFPWQVYGPVPNRKDVANTIMALDAESGREIWKREGDETKGYAGATLAVRGANVIYALENSVICVDARTGRQRWQATSRKGAWLTQRTGKMLESRNWKRGPAPGTTLALVLSDEAVYLAGSYAVWAFSMEDGSFLWTAPTHENHYKSADLFLVDGVVWTANTRGYDARTGKFLTRLKQKNVGPAGHDRCYRNRITRRWYINSVTGGSDFLALDDSGEFPAHWLRSTCAVGCLPCNGLLYVGPHACSCYNAVKLTGFNALAVEPGLRSSAQPIPLAIEPRVEKGPSFEEPTEPRQTVPARSWPTYRSTRSRDGCTVAAVGATLTPKWQAQLNAVGGAPTIAEGRAFVPAVDAHRVCAFDVDTGTLLWTYTTGGRVDSPPTWHNGRLFFGSHDGWVYCLHAKDGKLVWRFKALPDRSICAYGQVESAWPVSGSVLISKGIVYFCAGRNSFVDGGMVLFGLDPATGSVRHRGHLYGPYGNDGFPISFFRKGEAVRDHGMHGNKGDVLLADDRYVYLRHQAFTPDLQPVEPTQLKRPHLIATPGFLQPVPHHRSFWTLNTRLYRDRVVGRGPVQGDILVKNGMRFYEVRGYQPSHHHYFDPRVSGYTLFSGDIEEGGSPFPTVKERWKTNIPLTGKAMALAGDVLFVAGTPVAFPKDDLAKAYEGRMGGVLWAASARDGTKLASYKLDAPPVWDSLAAVDGRLLLCTTDGKIRCFAPVE